MDGYLETEKCTKGIKDEEVYITHLSRVGRVWDLIDWTEDPGIKQKVSHHWRR